MKLKFYFFIPSLFLCFISISQNWTLKLTSTIELRTWRLTTSAQKSEKVLGGATITLFKDKTQIGQTTSNPTGNFEIDIPAQGEFILTIAYTACNTKKFYVTTNGVPENVGKANYKPTVNITGFLMSKPIKGVDYIGLNEPLVKVEYKANEQNFDKDQPVTNNGLSILSKIYDAENTIIEKFCSANKSGDEALKKHNCILAKEFYNKAINLIPGEQYPIDQKEKAELCIKDKKTKEEAVAQLNAEQVQAAKTENEKAIAKKNEKNKEQFNKNLPEKTNTTTTVETSQNNNTSETTENNSGTSKHSIPQKFGADKYKEAITKADNYFKTKHYAEAKKQYEVALNQKPKDA